MRRKGWWNEPIKHQEVFCIWEAGKEKTDRQEYDGAAAGRDARHHATVPEQDPARGTQRREIY